MMETTIVVGGTIDIWCTHKSKQSTDFAYCRRFCKTVT